MAVVQDLILRVRTLGAKTSAAEVEGVGAAAKGMGGAFKTAAGVAGIGAMAFGLKDVTSSAIAFQAQSAQLTGALKNMGEYSQENVRRVTDAADTLATHGGFDPQTSIAGMTRLIAAHESVRDAIKNEGLITDIARRSGLAYNTVLRAVMTVEQGRTSGLTRLGIVIHPVVTAQNALTASHKKLTPEMRAQAKQMDQNATRLMAMRELWKRFGGATAIYSRTAAGGANNLKNSVEILGQRVGTFMLPIIQKVIHWLTSLANWFVHNKTATHALVVVLGVLSALWAASKIGNFVQWLGKLSRMLGLATAATEAQATATEAASGQVAVFGAAEEGAAGATGLLAAAMDALPLLAIIAVIALLITHLDFVKKVVHAVGQFFVSAFNTAKNAVETVLHWIAKHWPLLLSILTGPIGAGIIWIVRHWHQVTAVFSDSFNAIKGFVVGVFNWMKGAVTDVANWFRDRAHDIYKWVTGAFNDVLGFIKGLPGKIADAAKNLWDGLKSGLVSVINWIIDRFNGLPFIHGFDVGPVHIPGVPKIHHIGFERGGDVTASGAYIVGESGPELVYMPGGSHVVPNSDLQRSSTSGEGQPLENHITLQIGTYAFARAIAYTQTKAKAVR